MTIGLIVIVVLLLAVALSTVRSVPQAKVGVVTMFGKYRRVMNPGLNFKMPVIERINSYVPVQNQTAQLEFVAITIDQASVKFATTIIFTVKDHSAETMQKVAFLFINAASFQTAMTAQVEAAVRSLVATKQQSEVLGLRGEIITHAKETLDEQLESWGYLLVDLAINDIQFDAEVMASMSRVVAAKNSVIAAENEGQALLVKKTKEAEAQGAFIRIGAENEAKAAKLRGEGLAAFRTELTKGLSQSTAELQEAGADPSLIAFAMWTETVVQAAKDGQGNVLFLDGSASGMEETFKRLQGLTALQNPMRPKPPTEA